MKLHELSIKRPVTILMCVFIVLLLGFVSLSKIPIDLMPNIEFPIAIVSTSYSGVGPQEVESIVTNTIENAIASVGNVKSIQSQSSEGNSLVIVEFNSGTDMDFAALEMREKIDMVKNFFPDEVSAPIVMKMDPSMMPILNLSVTNGLDDAELKNFVEDKIQPRLERLDGVASISVSGGNTREIKVNVDPDKLSGYGLSTSQIIQSLQTENLNQPGGTVEYGDKKLLVRSTGEFKSLNDIKNVPIILPTGNTIYIRDVAEVEDGIKTISSYTRTDRKDSIGISVSKQSDANTVQVINSIKEEVTKLQNEYSNIKISIVFDQGEFIEQAINGLANNLIIGGLLAVLVLFIFLKNGRTTLIIGTAIPVSVIAAFTMIYFAGIKLNMISLGGLTLGVGMLVDNGIVVLENIYRYRTEGHSRIEAAMLGTQEVSGAVIASTLTTIVVFLPIVFTEGITAEIFKELAFTVVFSLLASLIVAFTLIPMLSSKYLKVSKAHEKSERRGLSRVLDKWDDVLQAIDNLYNKVLAWVLKHRKTTVFGAIFILIISLMLIPFVGMEFMPASDQGQFTVDINLAEGSLLENTNEVTMEVETIISNIEEVEKVFTTVGGGGFMGQGSNGNTASITVTLKALEERERSTSEVVDGLRNEVTSIPGAEIRVSEVDSMMGGGMGGSNPVSIQISGPDLDILAQISKEIEAIVKEVEGTRQVESSIAEARPEARIYVKRDKAAAYGMGTIQVASTIRTAVEGQTATRYKVNGEEIDIRVQLPESERKTYEQLKNIKLLTPTGAEVPLSDIADVQTEQGPITITREGQERYVNVTSAIFGRDVGSISRDIQQKLKDLPLPSGYYIEMGGAQEDMMESFASLGLALLLAVLLVYMVMAAQFESLLHPFVIMFALPLAYSGSALGLVITGRALSVPSFLGVIMLAGIVVNNAIVLVDYINTLRKRGMERGEAILKAGPTRLRPILMTTLTTMLALIPMALGIGEGSEMMAPMATVVIGGLLSSTLLTLVVVPVVYTIFDDIAAKAKKKKRKIKVADTVIEG